MSKFLTVRQVQILQFITDFITKNDYSPTLDEVAYGMHITVPAALKHIRALAKKGVLIYTPNQARSVKPLTEANIHLRMFEIPYFDAEPSAAETEAKTRHTYKISSLEIEDENYIAVQITIPTMEYGGIKTGDIAIVKRGDSAKSGTIVLAIASGDDTSMRSSLRRFTKLGENRCMLETDSYTIGSITTSNYKILGTLAQIKRNYDV
jgi:SOS-response transcriptional repressors (RecA-mediated autopeptidases)